MPKDARPSEPAPESTPAASFVARARDALDVQPTTPHDESLHDLFADGCAHVLLLEADRRRLAHRAARLAAGGCDLAALRALHVQMSATEETVAEVRALLAELSERLPSRVSRVGP